MNLWVKRVGQLAVLAVALFFFSCEEQTNLIGFKNPDSKYKLSFIDIPVKSSNILFDSIRTTNFYATNDANRLLVGHYADPVFGGVTASAYTQFLPLGSLPTNLGDSLVFVLDSAVLRLTFDYAYGLDGESPQKISVYEIEDPLLYSYQVTVPGSVGGQQKPSESIYNRQQEYFINSEVTYGGPAICSGTFTAKPEFNNSNKFHDKRMRLDDDFAERLFLHAQRRDSTVTNPSIFTTFFPGIAIVPQPGESDQVVGITPYNGSNFDSTYLRIHYHIKRIVKGTVKTDSLALDFNLNRSTGIISFNKIEADRTGSDLPLYSGFYQEDESGEKRYIQSGTGVLTKIDFSAFIDSLEDIPNLAINSAELVIQNVDDPQQFTPPDGLLVKLLRDNNRPKKLTYPGYGSIYRKDLDDLALYNGFVNFDARNAYTFNTNIPFDSTFNVVDDFGGFLTLVYDENSYKGRASLFFNHLHAIAAQDKTVFTEAVLIPYTINGRQTNGKSVNRVSFDKDNIKLRVYYTVPTIPLKD